MQQLPGHERQRDLAVMHIMLAQHRRTGTDPPLRAVRALPSRHRVHACAAHGCGHGHAGTGTGTTAGLPGTATVGSFAGGDGTVAAVGGRYVAGAGAAGVIAIQCAGEALRDEECDWSHLPSCLQRPGTAGLRTGMRKIIA